MAGAGKGDSWIEDLPAHVREAVLARMRPRHVANGEAIYVVNDPGDECYRVRSGASVRPA
jgi:CRP-like cAMP-binding protein